MSGLVRRADSCIKPQGANRTPSAPLSAAAPHPQEGLPEARPVSFSQEGFPKGRAAARPFVSFQGGAGGNRNPPAFLFRGPGGHSLFKREYPLGFSVPSRYVPPGIPLVGAANQTGSPYSAQVLLSVTFTSMNFPIRSFPPFSRTRRLPSVREERGKFSSSLSPSTSTRTVLPT